MYLGFWFWFSLVVTFVLFVCLYYLWKFANLILKVQDSLEACLDILDERYKSVNKILDIPIFFDSIEVRNCVNEIKKTRDAILIVANVLTRGIRSNVEDNEILTLDEGDNGD